MKNIDKLLESDDLYNSMLHSGLGWNLSMIGLVALGVRIDHEDESTVKVSVPISSAFDDHIMDPDEMSQFVKKILTDNGFLKDRKLLSKTRKNEVVTKELYRQNFLVLLKGSGILLLT